MEKHLPSKGDGGGRVLWRVGNGAQVRIWKDKWLSPPYSTLFHSPHQRLDADFRVSTLIDWSTGWWNIQLFQDIFTPDEATRICSVSPSPLQAPDAMIWQGTPHGTFTVRSAYFLEQNKRTQAMGESSCAREEDGFWQELWRVEAPAVVKNFVWKVGNDLHPTKWKLFQKNIVQNPACHICLQETEDVFHILWSCKSSMAVWQECGKKIQKLALGEADGKGLLQYLMRSLKVRIY